MKKKNRILIYPIVIMGALLIFTNSCKKDVKTPELFTTDVSAITQTTAMCGGYITRFDEKDAEITERGVCWSTSQNPTISDNKTNDGEGSGSFTSLIAGLSANTTYYLKAYATNTAGTGYGNTITFTTLKDNSNTVTDYDGNVYNTITIGTQVWMVENLKVSHYRNGEPIPNVSDPDDWGNLITGAFCNYDNSFSNGTTYGKLYNWYAVNDGRNIAPIGWHVPTDAEWTILTSYLGGASVAGGKLKETGTTHWASPNTGATNESGFTALPGGYRFSNGTFYHIGDFGNWWSSTEANIANDAWIRAMRYDNSAVSKTGSYEENGYSVRCVRDY